MFQSYYGMSCDPFSKEMNIDHPYESDDFKEIITRFKYLVEIKGIGLFIGEAGFGKTFSLRSFATSLNPDLYKVIYVSATKNMTTFDFFKEIGDVFNIDTGACYKMDLYNKIQKEMILLVEKEKKIPIIMIDDAHNLSKEILLNLKVLYEFEMDSKDYVTLLLVGKKELKMELSKGMYDYLKQRILVNYKLEGLNRQDIKEYVKTRLQLANVNHDLFSEDALNALYSCSHSSFRRLNTLILNCLLLGYQKKKETIDSEIVRVAKGEIDLE